MDLKSKEPFWLVKNGIINSYPSLHEDLHCDVLIVGGGITGSLIAHQCVEDGFKTILIDKREIANGSSSASTSLLQYEIDVPLCELIDMIGEEGAIASYHACSKAIDQLEAICKKIKSKAGFKKKKSLYFATFKKHIKGLRKEFESRKRAGFDVDWLDPETIEKKYQIKKTQGGILSKQGASVDAFKLVHELLVYNQKKGLVIYDKTTLEKVIYNSRSNEAYLNTGSKIKAKKIIYCIGYESTILIKEKIVDLMSTYALVSEVEPKLSKQYNNLLVWNTSEPYLYFRTTEDNRLLMGGEDDIFKNSNKRDILLLNKEQKLLKTFHVFFPHIEFRSDFVWAGTFGQTKDGLPYIGEHPDFKNSYFVLGFGGNGITFSVAGMEMVSNWLQGKKHSLTEWFRFSR